MTQTPVLIDGVPSDGLIPVSDSAVVRGDGCFEVIRIYQGEPFQLDRHLERLSRSAALLDIDLPPSGEIASWVRRVGSGMDEFVVRVLVTRGGAVPGTEHRPRVVVYGHRLPDVGETARLKTVNAPWHAAGEAWELAGAKVLSYAANMASSRKAKASGFDDALLISREGLVLEGPTFAVAWVVGGVIETPTLDLGILDSITRAVTLDLARGSGVTVVEGKWAPKRLDEASEVMALSTVREVQPVVRVDDRRFDPGEFTRALGESLRAVIAGDAGNLGGDGLR